MPAHPKTGKSARNNVVCLYAVIVSGAIPFPPWQRGHATDDMLKEIKIKSNKNQPQFFIIRYEM